MTADVTPKVEHNRIQTAARRFRILDALLLTLAVALSIAASSEFHPAGIGIFQIADIGDALTFANSTLLIFTVFLASLVLFDRMTLRRSVRRPGRACLIALLLVIPVVALAEGQDLAMAMAHDSMWWRFQTVVHFAVLLESDSWALPTVVATWAILSLQRRKIQISDWLDLAGIVAGALWIAYTFTLELYHWSRY